MLTNTPAQTAAIKKMMAARARELHAVARTFPKFVPGRTTTADYVQQYACRCNHPLPIANLSHHGSHAAPFLFIDDDQVLVEHDEDVIYA